MRLIYENKIGKIIFTGGGTGGIRLTDLTGLSLPETEAETIRYAGEPGQIVSRISVLPRTITASGDVQDKTGTTISYMTSVLSTPGVLTVVSRRNARMIPARCVYFTPSASKGNFYPFTVQFICDNPYFTDKTEQVVTLANRTAELKSPFLLPCVFSARKTEGQVLNKGTIKVLPKIHLHTYENAECENGIILKNHTTNAELSLHCGIRAGETIVVDCENRTVSGSVQGDLLHALSSATQLSEFYLATGLNLLSVHLSDEVVPISVSCRFYCRYGEAMI